MIKKQKIMKIIVFFIFNPFLILTARLRHGGVRSDYLSLPENLL